MCAFCWNVPLAPGAAGFWHAEIVGGAPPSGVVGVVKRRSNSVIESKYCCRRSRSSCPTQFMSRLASVLTELIALFSNCTRGETAGGGAGPASLLPPPPVPKPEQVMSRLYRSRAFVSFCTLAVGPVNEMLL